MKHFILMMCLISSSIADNIILTPFTSNGVKYMGEIPAHSICIFKFNGITSFAPGTSLTVSPYTETYGVGSQINPGDGMICGSCAVSGFNMIAQPTGEVITTLFCELDY
jgi:hypothetical protein